MVAGVLLLAIAFLAGCRGKEVSQVSEHLSLRLEHVPVADHIGPGDQEIVVKVSSSEGLSPKGVLLVFRPKNREAQTLAFEPLGSDYYRAWIPFHPRGTDVTYRIEATDVRGTRAVLPADPSRPYTFTFESPVPQPLLHAHIGSMMLGLLIWVLAAYFAVRYLRSGGSIRRCAWTTLAGTVLFFLGGFPLGMGVAYIAFGVPWTGFPLGWNVTDTKTLAVFVYWIIVLLLVRPLFRRETAARTTIGGKAFARLVLLGVIGTLVVYVIPHSAFHPLRWLWERMVGRVGG
jgi:hypothetical protein